MTDAISPNMTGLLHEIALGVVPRVGRGTPALRRMESESKLKTFRSSLKSFRERTVHVKTTSELFIKKVGSGFHASLRAHRSMKVCLNLKNKSGSPRPAQSFREQTDGTPPPSVSYLVKCTKKDFV